MITKQTVYLPVKVKKEDKTNIPSSVPQEKWGVHRTHCCKKHGCKYSNEYCPVVLSHIKQDYKCEDGDFDNGCFEPEVDELQKQELFVFTPEQLNEYTANVVRQSLETAAEKALVDIEECMGQRTGYVEVDKQSITNTFESTFKQFKV